MSGRPAPRGGTQLSKVLQAQFKNFWADPCPHLLLAVEDTNVEVWYFLVGGLPPPFLHGEYIFKLTAPVDFPQNPPRFEFCTQNGIFQPGGPICISVGEFHAKDRPGKEGSYGWRASLGMKGFAMQVVNGGMICCDGLDSGIRIKNLPDPLKMEYARASRAQNRRLYPRLYELFEAIIADTPELKTVRDITNARLLLEEETRPPRRPPSSAPEPSAPVHAEFTPRAPLALPVEPAPATAAPPNETVDLIDSLLNG